MNFCRKAPILAAPAAAPEASRSAPLLADACCQEPREPAPTLRANFCCAAAVLAAHTPTWAAAAAPGAVVTELMPSMYFWRAPESPASHAAVADAASLAITITPPESKSERD